MQGLPFLNASSLLLACLVVHGVSACSDAPTTADPRRPARRPTLTIVSGDGQAAEVGTLLPQPRRKEIRLFMGTHIEAVAGNCVLADLPPLPG